MLAFMSVCVGDFLTALSGDLVVEAVAVAEIRKLSPEQGRNLLGRVGGLTVPRPLCPAQTFLWKCRGGEEEKEK